MFVALVENVEKEENIMLVTKANAMKRGREEKKSEIEQLQGNWQKENRY